MALRIFRELAIIFDLLMMVKVMLDFSCLLSHLVRNFWPHSRVELSGPKHGFRETDFQSNRDLFFFFFVD